MRQPAYLHAHRVTTNKMQHLRHHKPPLRSVTPIASAVKNWQTPES